MEKVLPGNRSEKDFCVFHRDWLSDRIQNCFYFIQQSLFLISIYFQMIYCTIYFIQYIGNQPAFSALGNNNTYRRPIQKNRLFKNRFAGCTHNARKSYQIYHMYQHIAGMLFIFR